jgi:hypothetical protein
MPRGKARVIAGGGAFVLVSSTLSAVAGESASVSGDCLRVEWAAGGNGAERARIPDGGRIGEIGGGAPSGSGAQGTKRAREREVSLGSSAAVGE